MISRWRSIGAHSVFQLRKTRTHEPNSKILLVHACELGSRVWYKIGWRNGPVCANCNGSGAELSYHLLLAKDLGLMSKESFEPLQQRLTNVMRMLSSLSQKLKPSARRFS